MSNNLTTRELYTKRQKEYQDALVEQRVYANKLSEAHKAFQSSLAEAEAQLAQLDDEEFVQRFQSFLTGIKQADLDTNALEGYLITLQAFYDELDAKARAILNE